MLDLFKAIGVLVIMYFAIGLIFHEREYREMLREWEQEHDIFRD